MDKNLLDSEYKRSVRLGAPTDRFIVQANHILDVIINLYRFMPNVYYHKCRSYAFTYMVNTSVKNKNHGSTDRKSNGGNGFKASYTGYDKPA